MYFANMVLLDHQACRMVAGSGPPARACPSAGTQLVYFANMVLAGNSPVYGRG